MSLLSEKYICWRITSGAQRLGRKSRDKMSANPKAKTSPR